MASPRWFESVVQSYSADAHARSILAKLAIDASSVQHFTLHNGLLRYKDKIWVGEDDTLKAKLVQAFHNSPLGGHSGIPVTYRRLKQVFAWWGMNSFVHDWVCACLVCQQAKSDRSRTPGLLQPLEVPKSAWNTVSMDFIEGLPRSGSFNCILVVIDLFTKYAHFVPLTHPFTAVSVAQAFFHHIYKLHGLSSALMSDRDKIFTSKFWQALLKQASVRLHMSSSYHPQSDGQTERVNQCLETYLRCFIHACPAKWAQWLSMAEFWYNIATTLLLTAPRLKLCMGIPRVTLLCSSWTKHLLIFPISSKTNQ
jgi:transposase InsO family protein